MNKITAALEEIAKFARASQNPEDLKKVIQSAREAIRNEMCHPRESGDQPDSRLRGNDSLQELDKELSTWESKLGAIWKEPVGREGMARHARYWMEKLRHSESAEGGRRI